MDCRFLHRWKWTWVDVPDRHANGSSNGNGGGYWRLNCLFCGAVSHRTAPGPSDRDKGSPHTTAGVSPSTGAPAPFKGA
ncbi:hypothetical protein LCGC14_2163360 [marine sediment metagenome]|uniref:Uncharacterized protein n=1 Tax=marine sediment metagenome TaxID=412755 RepID=A0A0F9EEB7_9ZZZZ